MNVAFIGLGVFGQAIASLVEENGFEYEFAEQGKLLTRHADIAFLMVPTKFMRQALEDNLEWLNKDTIIVNGAKGIEQGSRQFAHQIVASVGDFPRYFSLMGPSFAHGITEHHPTLVSLGYREKKHIPRIRSLLETPYFQIQESAGVEALELASALKNVYAVVCGYAEGLGLGMNTQAQLVTRGLGEFQQLATALGFTDYDVTAPGVVGDLILTCTSDQSRNFQYGMSLSQNSSSRGDLPEGKTVEGYYASDSIAELASKHKLKLPVIMLAQALVHNQKLSIADFCKRLIITI